MNNENTSSSSLSKIALLISNFVPMFGVVFYQWDVSSIIFLYWLETLVILIFSIIKIKKAQGNPLVDQKEKVTINGVDINNFNKRALIRFSKINNGILILFDLVMIFSIFGLPKMSAYPIYIALFSIILSHYISYSVNYIGKEEFLKISPARIYLIPENRLLIIMIVSVFGGLVVEMARGYIVALIIMIALKTMADLYAHVKEHKYIKTVSMEISSGLYKIKESDLLR